MKIYHILLTVALCSGCATASQTTTYFVDSIKDYKLEVMENNKSMRFDITLTSLSNRTLCISIEDWPNNIGQVSGGGQRASLWVNGSSTPSQDSNFGYCFGKACAIRLKKLVPIKGFVGYREFGRENDIAKLTNKEMRYLVKPYYCGK